MVPIQSYPYREKINHFFFFLFFYDATTDFNCIPFCSILLSLYEDIAKVFMGRRTHEHGNSSAYMMKIYFCFIHQHLRNPKYTQKKKKTSHPFLKQHILLWLQVVQRRQEKFSIFLHLGFKRTAK